jgi:hypothetical protein
MSADCGTGQCTSISFLITLQLQVQCYKCKTKNSISHFTQLQYTVTLTGVPITRKIQLPPAASTLLSPSAAAATTGDERAI